MCTLCGPWSPPHSIRPTEAFLEIKRMIKLTDGNFPFSNANGYKNGVTAIMHDDTCISLKGIINLSILLIGGSGNSHNDWCFFLLVDDGTCPCNENINKLWYGIILVSLHKEV